MIEVYLKSKGKYKYNAKAIYDNGKFILKKGSIINSYEASSERFKFSSILKKIKNDKTIVVDNKIQKDIEFSSATKAGIFVCGYSMNGPDRWKTADGKKLKDVIGGEKNE